MKIKIYGYGWVGKAMKSLFPDALVHDPQLKMINNEKADVAFVCVPTPNNKEGSLDTSIVEEVVLMAKENLIIIRSTVMPGTCDKLIKGTFKRIVFQPEYLGETVNHPMSDQESRPFMIIGGNAENRRSAIEVYQKVYNAAINIRQVSCLEAEVIKLSENRAIAFKVAQCQELYDVCEAAGVDYYTIREAVYGDDPRFTLWFTFVYPEKRGFHSSKCLKKDVEAWAAWAESCGVNADITRLIVNKSKEYEKNITN